MDPRTYAALDARLRKLEREAGALRTDLQWAATFAAGAAPPAVAAPSASAPPPDGAPPAFAPEGVPPAAPRAAFSLEGLVAGRGLQLVGLFLVLLGTAFFLNLAFTRGWIGPAERIVLGLVAGAALLAEGARRRRPADVPVAEGLIGLGAGILYLSLWAAVAVFPQLHVPRVAAFVAMIAVTGLLAALATTRRAERVALLGLAGGFLTPLLLSSDVPDRTLLAVYLLVLGGAFAALGLRSRFRYVEAAAFVASALYLPMFAPVAGSWPVAAAVAVTTMIFALYAVTFSIGAARAGEASRTRVALLVLDTFAYAGMLVWIFAGRDTALGIALLALAAAFLAVARFVTLPKPLLLAYGYLGLAAATLALPALLHRTSLLDALSIEGAVLVVLGARRADRHVALGGTALLGLASVWLLGDAMISPPANTPFSALALAFAIAVAALAYARTQIAHLSLDRFDGARWANAANVAANVVAVAGISRVLLDALGGPSWNLAVPSHAQVALSLAWTAYATALFGIGLQRDVRLLRRQGLALYAITIFKVFTVDLANVEVAWRIASFVVLGIVCIAVSAWYMRAQARGKEAEA